MYNFIKIAIGIFLVGMGICDICKRKIRWGYSDNMKPKERAIWQRWIGVVELVVGGCELLYVPFAGMQRVTSVAACGAGPYSRSASWGPTSTGGASTRTTPATNDFPGRLD